MNDVFAKRVRNKSTEKNPGPALREGESVGIWLRPLGNVAYVACLPLLSGVRPSGLMVRASD